MGSEDVTLRPGVAPPLGRGGGDGRLTRFGRFIVLDRLGAGGSGVVHRAYDPELDRSVAIKVLHAGGATERLLAEGRAMAKLRHPNVVPVYDVGEAEEHVWLAMEYVEGGTLRQWLDASAREREHVVEAFQQAGRGLAAAHVQGLTHRDFKPDNVLVYPSGRVAVTDFGVATPTESFEQTQGDVLVPQSTTPMLGTPVYMSPEQVLGEPIGPASDQFSFGVALYEGLYGRRPFEAETLSALSDEIVKAQIEFPSRGRDGVRVPPWLRAAVVRMLAREPQDRFGSMDAAVEALGLDPRGLRRRVGAVLGVVAVVGVGGWMLTQTAGPDCDAAAAQAAQVWNLDRRAEVTAWVAEAGPSASLMPHVFDQLDAWTAQWSAGVTDACEATHVRGTQSEMQLDSRMRCFDRQLTRAATFVGELEDADPDVLRAAYDAVVAFPSADACEDPFEFQIPTPEELEAWRWYAKATVHDDLGQFEAGLDAVDQGLEALGERPAAARTALRTLEGQLARRKGDHVRAEAAGRAAVLTDLDLAGPRRTADAWLELALNVGTDQGRSARAEGLLLAAESAVRAVNDPGYDLRLLSVRGTALMLAGRTDEALDALSKAAELARATADPVATSLHLHNYASALTQGGRPDEALELLGEAMALDRRTRPPLHPVFVRLHQNRAIALTELGRVDEAVDALSAGLEIAAEMYGPDAPRLGDLHLGVGAAQIEAHRFTDARESIERAKQLWSPLHPASHRVFETAEINLGVIANELGQHERALEHYRSARERAVERQGDEGMSVAILFGNEANTLRELDRHDEAIALGRRALRIEEKLAGPASVGLAYPLVGLARSLLAIDQHEQAVEAATRAVQLRERAQTGPADLYTAYITLALALVEADPARIDEARRWGLAAREAFEETGLPEHEAELLRAFEAAHPNPPDSSEP